MSGLEHLLAQASNDEWHEELMWTNEATRSLVGLATDAVRLLIDMAAALNRALGMLENDRGGDHQDRVLLARFADLDQKAGTA